MSDSTPTAHERIRRAATVEAYAHARQLGSTPIDAYREADMVAGFIADAMAVEPRGSRAIYDSLLRRFCDAVE